ncbi:MAG: MBL fold metallo-hydrolase [Planctomycetes bacterium]|nr:MBL fold metallo-hydrolase [Planctomycetota bacterium]
MAKSTPCLYVLDVGHGSSAILCDTEGTIVIDSGKGSSLYLFLKQEHITTIDLVLISHADEDHLGGLIGILASEEFDVKKVRVNSDASKDTKIWDDILYTLDKMQRNSGLDFEVSLTENFIGSYNHGRVDIQVVAPSCYLAGRSPGSSDRKGRRITSHSICAVIRLLLDGQPVVLLPSDIDMTGLANILENSIDISTPLVSFSHHGGIPGSAHIKGYTKTFCEAVKPEGVIFSIGRDRHKNPQPDIVSTVKEILPNAFILCTQLSKHCAVTIESSHEDHLSDTFAHGKERGICCAGTIVIDMSNGDIKIHPDKESHASFVNEIAQSAICLEKTN